jgi:hypothetical protein
MISPSNSDIGRRVIYSNFGKEEVGEIVSINDGYVFVRYDSHGETPMATARENLTWASLK